MTSTSSLLTSVSSVGSENNTYNSFLDIPKKLYMEDLFHNVIGLPLKETEIKFPESSFPGVPWGLKEPFRGEVGGDAAEFGVVKCSKNSLKSCAL
jgi:hypothetical protein